MNTLVSKTLIILFSFLFLMCNGETNSSHEIDTNIVVSGTEENIATEEQWLLIEGQDIWVRLEPSTGEVIMKLNTGDRCKVLEKGKFEKIKDIEDYWYKISFNGKEGWVFGSQTSIKQQKNEESKGEKPTAQSAKELLKKLKAIAQTESERMTQECECMYEISPDLALENERYAFINYNIKQCGATCIQSNSSILITKQNDVWKETLKFDGAFKYFYNSKLKDQILIVTENIHQNHLMEKETLEEVYFLDERDFKLKKIDITAKSCEILSPTDFGCEYCNNNSTQIEKLKLSGDPVQEIEKIITIIKYDDDCKKLSEKKNTIIYKWKPEELDFKQIAN